MDNKTKLFEDQVNQMINRARWWMTRKGTQRKPLIKWLHPKDTATAITFVEARDRKWVESNKAGKDLLDYIILPFYGTFEPTLAMVIMAVASVCKPEEQIKIDWRLGEGL